MTGLVRGDGPVRDDDAVAWLRAAGLSHRGRDVSGLVPGGFEAYARILHPAGRGDREVPWSEIAAWSGRALTPTADSHELGVRGDGVRWDEQPGCSEPMFGTGGQGEVAGARLAASLAAATGTPDRVWVLVDEIEHHVPGDGSTTALTRGYLPVPLTEVGVRLRPLLPLSRPWPTRAEREQIARDQQRRERFGVELAGTFFLYPARFAASARAGWWEVSYAWPDDRAWVTCTNIDCPTTYVGGSAELIERLLADDVLEALPAQLTDPWDGHG